MRFFGPEEVAHALPWDGLIAAIESVLESPSSHAPQRTAHTVEVPGSPDAALLLKPGWAVGDVIAVKAVTFFPDNGLVKLPTINAGVLLFSGTNGQLLGACDGNVLTAHRTAAASAVAAKRLVREDVERLLVVGTGALAPRTAEAHAAVREYATIEVWGRDMDKASTVVDELVDLGLPAVVSADLDASVAAADVISCVTGSSTPLVKGALLRSGCHVDLIGAFTPAMRESDDDVIRRGSVWVDTREDAVLAGDLAQPLDAGLLQPGDLKGDLAELVTGRCQGRTSDEQITVFKSAGTALEDLAAARLVFEP